MNKTLYGAVISTLIGATSTAAAQTTGNQMNPAISVILQGQAISYQHDPEHYELPGFMLGGESALPEPGLGLGHGELLISSNIDDLYYGQLALALADHGGETVVEMEEAYFETIGLNSGLTVRGGRFLSNIGYLNSQHTHAWDFIDTPLIYKGLFGKHLVDDGIQLRWLAPTDTFFQIGAEFGRGERFPAGGASNEGAGTQTYFIELGGDIGNSQSWQLGLSHWKADVVGRTSGGHAHGAVATETPTYTGTSSISALDIVWKWAPNGNYAETNLKFQAEYFLRNEDGIVEMIPTDPIQPTETTTYTGEQQGWYTQLSYQFTKGWRTALRYDQLEANNSGSDAIVLTEAGLDSEGHTPSRSSLMIEYARSEFSQIRLQYNLDDSYEQQDRQISLQYIMSLGAHGAHQF